MFFNKKAKLLKQKEEELSIYQSELNLTKEELQKCKDQNNELLNKYSTIIEKDKFLAEIHLEIDNSRRTLTELNQKYQTSLKTHSELEKELNLYQDSLEIGSFGLYSPQFNFDTSEKFKEWIEDNYQAQKQLIREDTAVVCHIQWEVGGSKVEGRKMTNQYKKLMLFAFNGECDGLIAKVKWNNALKTKERIIKSFDAINKLGTTQHIEITKEFLALKLQELALYYEYEQKKYEEKEEQRRIREEMREEEKAQKELERAQKEAEDEEKRFNKALEKAKQELGNASLADVEILNEQIKALEVKLQEAHERKERAISMAQLTKVGHIYIISNVGSFGDDVYKIGMTRRLEPLDRVRELGDASVPFHFDVHAIIYSENAPQLEYELHQKFGDRRINRKNNKKEFFRVTLDEIELFIKQHANAEIEFTKIAEAREYRETLTLLEQLNKLADKNSEESKFPASLL